MDCFTSSMHYYSCGGPLRVWDCLQSCRYCLRSSSQLQNWLANWALNVVTAQPACSGWLKKVRRNRLHLYCMYTPYSIGFCSQVWYDSKNWIHGVSINVVNNSLLQTDTSIFLNSYLVILKVNNNKYSQNYPYSQQGWSWPCMRTQPSLNKNVSVWIVSTFKCAR
jgi:hypothetical protein